MGSKSTAESMTATKERRIRSTTITALKSSVIPVRDNWKGQFGDFYSKLKDVADPTGTSCSTTVSEILHVKPNLDV